MKLEPSPRSGRAPGGGLRARARRGPRVAIFLGSASDLGVMEPARKTLDGLGVPCQIRISSAHRTPERTAALVKACEAQGTEVYICAAGMAAHLAGAVAALTTHPVIGVPLASGSLGGLDALLSTVQMPPGVPVATVATGGAVNAAILAAQILALSDRRLSALLKQERSSRGADVVEKDERLRSGD